MSAAPTLPGFTLDADAGRRTTRTEWGVAFDPIPGVHKAGVQPAADREHAEAMAAGWGPLPGGRLVTRTVVTYTPAWTDAEEATT